MDEVERIAHERRPKLILAGWSAYPRVLDFERFREIADEVGALLMVDMAHFAGLVAAGLHPNPVPYADVVTTTIHKTLGGARGGMILCREEYAKKINSAVFPGQQGGPLEHVIAGKAVALKIAGTEPFRERQQRTVAGAQGGRRGAARRRQRRQRPHRRHRRAPRPRRPARVRARRPDGRGPPARHRDHGQPQRGPVRPAPAGGLVGLRVGTSALATRGVQAEDFTEIGDIIARALQPGFDRRRPSSPSASPRSPTATRSTRSWALPPRSRSPGGGLGSP